MSFKLTYATMFDPPEELHQRFEAAMARVSGSLGRRHPLYIDGEDRDAPAVLHKMNPANDRQLLGEFAAGTSLWRYEKGTYATVAIKLHIALNRHKRHSKNARDLRLSHVAIDRKLACEHPKRRQVSLIMHKDR